MKRHKLLILIITLSFVSEGYSQHCSESLNTTTTDWRAVSSKNRWDWTTESFNDLYIKGSQANPHTILSPFYPNATGHNPNLERFYTDHDLHGFVGSDFHPEDGWELLIKDFGETNGREVANPFFALYNRYRSLIRVFYYITEVPTSPQNNGALILLRILPDDLTRQTNALFAQSKPIASTMLNFEKGLVLQVPNYYVNENGYWLYADFNVAYDPCICTSLTKLELEFTLMSQSEVKLELELHGTMYNIVTHNNVNNTNPFQQSLGFFNNVYEAGNKSYKTWEGFKKDAIITTNAVDDALVKNGFLAEFGFIKDLIAPLPYIGFATGLISWLSAGGNADASSPSRPPVAYIPYQKLDMSGSANGKISQSSPYGNRNFWTPGTKKILYGRAADYNNLLGVFNLPDLPAIDLAEYHVFEPGYKDKDGEFISFSTLPRIVEFKLSDDIRYLLNPAAGLEVESIEAAFVMKYHFTDNLSLKLFADRSINSSSKPVAFGIPTNAPLTLEERYADLQLEIESWPKDMNSVESSLALRTRYLPLQCFKNRSVLLFSSSYFPEIFVKLIIKLKRLDNNGQRVVYVATYPVKKRITHGGLDVNNFYHVDMKFDSRLDDLPDPTIYVTGISAANNPGGSFFKIKNMWYQPNTITLSNINVTENVFAKENVTILDNVNISSGIVVKAGKSIDIFAENTYSPEVSFKLGLDPEGCELDIKSLRMNTSEITSLCNFNYRTYSTLGKRIVDSEIIKVPNGNFEPQNESSIGFSVFPNPVSINAMILIKTPTPLKVMFSITDATGHVVASMENYITLNEGNHELPINMSQLPSGVYFCSLLTFEGSVITKKVIVLK